MGALTSWHLMLGIELVVVAAIVVAIVLFVRSKRRKQIERHTAQ